MIIKPDKQDDESWAAFQLMCQFYNIDENEHTYESASLYILDKLHLTVGEAIKMSKGEEEEMKGICKDCIYFNQMTEGRTDLGYCQFTAPIIIPTIGYKTGQFPIMSINGWCGEWEGK